MKAYQVFARMSPERATSLMGDLEESARPVYTQAVAAASAVMKARPKFIMGLDPAKRAQMVRRALSRVASNALSEEVLASYFLGPRKDLLIEWLDALGLKHEEGALEEDDPACPADAELDAALASFRKDELAEDRDLLLQAFAAQTAIDWPALEARLGLDAEG